MVIKMLGSIRNNHDDILQIQGQTTSLSNFLAIPDTILASYIDYIWLCMYSC